MTQPKMVIPAELRQRIFFTIAMVAIYRIGVAIPTPGVDGVAVLEFFNAQSGSLFGLFNTFTGGALERFSVFALGIMPYISASIIFQLLQSAVPHLEKLKKEGEQGRKKITQYTRYATILLAVIQGYAMASWLQNSPTQGKPIVITPYFGVPFLSFHVMTVTTLAAGTCFIMWLGEQISEHGVGNGSSLIIFTGIAAGIPSDTVSLWHMIASGEMSAMLALIILTGMFLVIGFIIFVEVGQRRIPVQYSQRGQGRMAMQTPASHLPLKVNFANVIPPIFASSLLLFPATLANFVTTPWIKNLQNSLTPTGGIYNILFVGLIVFFCFFYTEIAFNPNDVSDNLKKWGGFIPGIRAGRSTADYLVTVLTRLTVVGSIYLSAICIMPSMLVEAFHVPFYFGGTTVLILIGVALDTSQQIQSHLITAKYEGVLKGVKMRSRRVQY
ncbi:MAG: preprotein translocase subunit SecY [Bdellovibrionales bacterium RBG_16_40_8]|nr:MAG: preprotein translocase subunit SecY [Bdellovibrionales bacterium RBG_16_40_8]